MAHDQTPDGGSKRSPAARRATGTVAVPDGDAVLGGRGRSSRPKEPPVTALRERIVELEDAQNELLSVISHDLRNPLSVIMVSSRLLLRSLPEGGEGDEARRQLEAIGRATDEMNTLIQDLVDAGAIEAGLLSLGCEPEDTAALVDRAVAATAGQAARKPVLLTAVVAPALPRVLGDRHRLEQVLTHLIGNALRFTPKGGSITVRAEQAAAAVPSSPGVRPRSSGGGAPRAGPSARDLPSVVRFAVTDDGPGIPLAHRAHLLCRSAAGARRPMSQGTGLGVYVAKGIVEAHGGEMWVESEIGRGTTFYFTVPAERRSP